MDYEDEMMETDEQLLIDSQSEAESQRQFFKAVRNLGYVLSAKYKNRDFCATYHSKSFLRHCAWTKSVLCVYGLFGAYNC